MMNFSQTTLYKLVKQTNIINIEHMSLYRDVFCAGRVPDEDLKRTMKACGGAVQTSVNDLSPDVLGTCENFEEEQIGGER